MKLTIDSEKLRIKLEGLERVLALKGGLEIPLKHIVRADTETPESGWTDLRIPGTSLPGVIKAGTYYTRRGKEFWYVTRGKKYLILELENEDYRRIVLGLNDNKYWAEIINNAV